MREVLILCLVFVARTEAATPEEGPVEIDTASFHDDGGLAQDDKYSDHHEMPEVPSGSEEHVHKAASEYSQQDIIHPSPVFRTLSGRPGEYNYSEHSPSDYGNESADYEVEFDSNFHGEPHYPHDTYERHDYVSMEGPSSSEERLLDGPSTHRGRKYWRYEGLQGHPDELDHHLLHSESSGESRDQSKSQRESSEKSVSDEHGINKSGSHADESQENDGHEGQSRAGENHEIHGHESQSHEKHNENSHREDGSLETEKIHGSENDESERNENDSDESESGESGSDDSESGESERDDSETGEREWDENESAQHHARYTHYHSHNHHDKDQDVHKMLHHHFHLIIPKHHVEDLFSHEEDADNKPLLGFQFFDKEHHNMMEDHLDGDDSGASDSSSHESESESNEGNSSEDLSLIDHSSHEASYDHFSQHRSESHEHSSEHSDSLSDERYEEDSEEGMDENSYEHSDEHSDEQSDEHSDEHSHRDHFHYGHLSDMSSEEESSEEYPVYKFHHGSSRGHQAHHLHSDSHDYHHDRHPHYHKISNHEDDLGKIHYHDSDTSWRDGVDGGHDDVPIYRNHHRNHYSERSESKEQNSESDESLDEMRRSVTGHSHDHGERAHHKNKHWMRDSEEASGSMERKHYGGLSGDNFHKHGDWESRRHNPHDHNWYHLGERHTSKGHPERHIGHHARNIRFHPMTEEHSHEDFDRARHQKVGHFESTQFQDWHRSNPLGHHGRTFPHHDLSDEDGGHGFSHRGSHKGRHQHLHEDLDNPHGQRDLHSDRQDTSSLASDDEDKLGREDKLPDIIPVDDKLKGEHHGVNDEDYKAIDGHHDHPHEPHLTKKEDTHEEDPSDMNTNAGSTVGVYHHRHHVGHFGGQLLGGSKHDYVDMHSNPFRSRLVEHSYHPHKIVTYGRPIYPKYQF